MQLSGIKAHIWQRISAAYLLLFFPYLYWQISQISEKQVLSLSNWAQQVFTPFFSVISFIAIALVFIHVWVGIRDIIIDYIPRERVNLWLKICGLFLAIIAIDFAWLIFTLLL